MSPRWILVSDARGAILWHPRLAPDGIAAASPTAATALVESLAQARDLPVTILAADAAQEVIQETLPALGRRDRAQLAQRRMAAAWPEAGLRGVMRIDRWQATWRLTAQALRPENPAFTWIDWLNAQAHPCDGVITLATLGAALPTILHLPTAPWQQLLFLDDTQMHMIGLCGGAPILLRQIALPSSAHPEERQEMVNRQLQANRFYLARFGWNHDTPEEVLALGEIGGLLPPLCSLSTAQAARQLGCAPKLPIVLAACVQRARLPRLRTAALEQAGRTRRLRQLGWAVAGLVATVSLLALSSLTLLLTEEHGLLATQQQQLTLTQTAIRNLQHAAGDQLAPLTRRRQAQALRDLVLPNAGHPWMVWRAAATAALPVNSFAWTTGGDVTLTIAQDQATVARALFPKAQLTPVPPDQLMLTVSP